MTKVTRSKTEAEEPQFPCSWLWDEDGDECFGTFVRFDRGQTRGYGRKTIVVLHVGDEDRSVWLYQTALYSQMRDELADRPGRQLNAGERILIRRLEMKPNADASREYRDFDVYFIDRPEPSPEECFPDLPPIGDLPAIEEPPEPGEATSSDAESGIPF
jgi:hypothetical protein